MAIALSTARHVDGLWLGVFQEDEAERIFGRVEQALGLIKTHDRRLYDRLPRDVERVWVWTLPEALASYNHALRACQLSTRLVLAETSTPEIIATTIVHEATHARLKHCHIGYPVKLRPRVESVCIRRELAFAARLPNGQAARELAERRLAWVSEPAHADHWTDQAREIRFLEAGIEDLRQRGVPPWILKLVLWLRSVLLRAKRLFRDEGPSTGNGKNGR